MAKKKAAKAADPEPSPATEVPAAEVPQRFEVIEVSRIHVTSANPRKSFNDEDLAELASSIREHGILEPLVVRQMLMSEPQEYELIAGERRLRAAIIAGLQSVPCMVREIGDTAAREIMLLENLQREDLQPLEISHALEELLKGTTQEALATRHNRHSAVWRK